MQQDPNSVIGDERQQLESVIGSRSIKGILAGKQTPWVPKFQGISAQLWDNSGHTVAPIQAKLTIGEPGDKYEQEADRVASQVVKQINVSKPVQLRQGQTIQRRGVIGGEQPSTVLDKTINSARGSGQPIEASLQHSIGQAMGADFSGVRVHTGTQADKLAQSIQAEAFTTGQDVFFRQGKYEPESLRGQELIAHELTHVVQQNGGAVRRSSLLPQQSAETISREQQPVTGVIQRAVYADMATMWATVAPD
ncbi:DUF4157 domain-containing protein, partial [Nostoc sp. LEGE 12450]|nr:DUF4157 domain-containing protein [Nostoc sp. LEGE 12450]